MTAHNARGSAPNYYPMKQPRTCVAALSDQSAEESRHEIRVKCSSPAMMMQHTDHTLESLEKELTVTRKVIG
jgi:hypothetical protein